MTDYDTELLMTEIILEQHSFINVLAKLIEKRIVTESDLIEVLVHGNRIRRKALEMKAKVNQ